MGSNNDFSLPSVLEFIYSPECNLEFWKNQEHEDICRWARSVLRDAGLEREPEKVDEGLGWFAATYWNPPKALQATPDRIPLQ